MNKKVVCKKTLLFMSLLFCCCIGTKAQGGIVKTNLFTDIVGTLSIGGEYQLSAKTSASLMLSYNAWTKSDDNKKMNYFLIQPEYRKWLRGVYNGYFVGVQANYGQYNVGGMYPWYIASMKKLDNSRFQGDLIGVGISNGYQWVLSPRFNLELSASVGFLHCTYNKYYLGGFTPISKSTHNHWGLTQLGLTLVYYI